MNKKIKSLLLLSLMSVSVNAIEIHDLFDSTTKGKSNTGTVDDFVAQEDGVGIFALQYNGGKTKINNELKLQSVLNDIIKKSDNTSLTANVKDSLLSGSLGTSVQLNEFKTIIDSAPIVVEPLTGDQVSLGGSDYVFPAGYTAPPATATGNSCSRGYENKYVNTINCSNGAMNYMGTGWLRLSEYTSGTLFVSNNPTLSNINNLKNLTKSSHLYFGRNNIGGLTGLQNLIESGTLNFYQNNIYYITQLANLRTINGKAEINFGYNHLINIEPLDLLVRNMNGDLINVELKFPANTLTNLSGLDYLKKVNKLDFSNNNINDISALSRLNEVGKYFDTDDYGNARVGGLNLSYNNLNDVNGLNSLTTVYGRINLSNNNIQNVNALSTLTNIKSSGSDAGLLTLVNNPQLTDISGLNNIVQVDGNVILPNKTYTVKLDSTSYLCQNPTKILFDSGALVYSRVCN